MNRTGQLNLEFLAAAGLFIIMILGLITTNQILPSYDSSMDRMTLNLEAKTVSDQMLTEPGRHSYGSGGDNWEKNSSTVSSSKAFGLAKDHHVIARDKLEKLKTADLRSSIDYLNYTEFRELTEVNNQYRLNFVWLPTVQANYSFTKTRPPSEPPIEEPEKDSYSTAENEVHYGTVTLRAIKYNFLITAHDGVYDSVYVSEEDWDFSDSGPSEPYGVGDIIQENGFEVVSFQNRENDKGSLLVLSRKIKDFGPTVNRNTEVITLDRYAILEGEPLRVEVTAW